MNVESELREILEELKRYFEFQKSLGIQSVVLLPPKEEELRETPANIPARPQSESDKPVIRVDEQMSIFDTGAKRLTLEEIRAEIGDCTRCKLHESRTHIVFGEGNPKARLVFVGEGPGQEEDRQARPFVGRAGQLLTKIISAMGFERSDVYICNVVKCRPPGNRTPEADETGTCEQFLFKQLRTLDPKIIVCLGSVAAQSVLKTKEKLGNLRGKFHSYGRSKIIVTYHPAALLRNPGFKRPLWDDMQIVMKEMGVLREPQPTKSREQF